MAATARPAPVRAAPEHRWVTVEDAVERLPIRDTDARALLYRRGLVEQVDGRDLVWLPRLAELGGRATKRTVEAPPALTPLPSPRKG